MIGLVVCPPTDITGDHVTDLRHSNVATGCGFMQCGHFVAVVLLPIGVLVLEDDVAVQRMDVVLIEGPEVSIVIWMRPSRSIRAKGE